MLIFVATILTKTAATRCLMYAGIDLGASGDGYQLIELVAVDETSKTLINLFRTSFCQKVDLK